MTMLIPTEKGYKCKDCDFLTPDLFTFLDHCEISFEWKVRLSSQYSLELFAILDEMAHLIDHGDLDNLYDLIQSIALALVNASEGEETLHRFINEAHTVELAADLVQGVEELLKEHDDK
jgi:hypothetical protein